MKGILWILFVLSLVLSISPALAADSAAGKKLYDTNCSKLPRFEHPHSSGSQDQVRRRARQTAHGMQQGSPRRAERRRSGECRAIPERAVLQVRVMTETQAVLDISTGAEARSTTKRSSREG